MHDPQTTDLSPEMQDQCRRVSQQACDTIFKLIREKYEVKEKPQKEFIPPYEGNDMAGYIMEKGFKLYSSDPEVIKSITNVHDEAIIVTDYSVYKVSPEYQVGFCIRLLTRI
jgi:hypothetical protein